MRPRIFADHGKRRKELDKRSIRKRMRMRRSRRRSKEEEYEE